MQIEVWKENPMVRLPLRRDCTCQALTAKAARNLDMIQEMVHAILFIWKHKRRKLSDKRKGTAELIRELAHSFTKIIRMLSQNEIIFIFYLFLIY